MGAKIGTVHWKKFDSFLSAQGCVFVREVGDHRIYYKEGLNRPLVVPRYTQLPPFIILNNLRTLGVSRDTYLDFLHK